MADSKRITFRLDAAQVAGLEKLCRETGSDASAVVRAGLADLLNRPQSALSRAPGNGSNASQHLTAGAVLTTATASDGGSRSVAVNEAVNSTPASSGPAELCLTASKKAAAPRLVQSELVMPLPSSVAELVPQARALGLALRKVRRLQFERVLAASLVATENSEDGRDHQLLVELLRIGREFGMLS